MTKSSAGKKFGQGLGLAALAAAGAASYYFYGKDGKKHKKQAGAWLKAAKAEVDKKIRGMKSAGKLAFDKAAKDVLAKYKQAKNIDPKELAVLGQELKKHAENIYKDVSKFANKNITVSKKKTPTKKSKLV